MEQMLICSTSQTLSLSDGTLHAGAEGSPFDPTDVLTSACELANTRASKILMVRGEQHAALSIEQYVEVFNESWSFVLATESLAKRMIASLRGVAASQTRSFLVSYHAQRLTKSARLVEEETWVQVDVPPATQHAVDLFVEAAVSDPAECFIPPKETNGTPNGGPKGPTKLVNVEDKSFSVVKATAESLTLLGEYLAVVINLELVVTDVMSRVIEFLKSFNSRTCQVVLGAGAMRSAGLRNITAKHLALASQSLSVVVALIPYIREFIRRHLNPRQAVMLVEFDKLKRDYQEHQNEIHAKLVAIMADRLAVHVAELREIDWEATPDREGPNSYCLMLAKETATLHKVLSKYLSPSTVDDVMSKVITASVNRLSEEYSRVELRSEDAKKRMLQDAALIGARMGPLAESGATVASLEALVREKTTPRKPVAQAMRGLLPGGSEQPADTPDGEKAEAATTQEERLEPQRQGSKGWREVGDVGDAVDSGPATPVRSSSPRQSAPSSPSKEAKPASPVPSPDLPSLPSSVPQDDSEAAAEDKATPPAAEDKPAKTETDEVTDTNSKEKSTDGQPEDKPDAPASEDAPPTVPPKVDNTAAPPAKDVDNDATPKADDDAPPPPASETTPPVEEAPAPPPKTDHVPSPPPKGDEAATEDPTPLAPKSED